MKKIFCIFLITFLSSCYRPDLDFDEYEDQETKSLGIFSLDTLRAKAYKRQQFGKVPYPKVGFFFDYEDLEQDYEEGFQHGCQTMLSAIGRTLERFRGTNFDAEKLANNEKYLRGYKDAESYCLHKTDWELH